MENNSSNGTNPENQSSTGDESNLRHHIARGSQFVEMTMKMRDAGLFGPEEAEYLLNSANINAGMSDGIDNLSTLTAKLNETFQAGKTEDFILPRTPNLTNDERQQYESNTRAWMATAGLPVAIGNHVAEEMVKAKAHYQSLSANEQQIWQRTESSKVRQLFGDKTNLRTGLAAVLAFEIDKKHPGFMKMLDSGPGYSLTVISQLALHAERLLDMEKAQEV